MKLQHILILFMSLVIFLFSCSGDRSQTAVKEMVVQKSKTFPKNKPASSYDDTLLVNVPAAVFYIADSVQLIKIKNDMDPGAFDANMHEYENLFKTSMAVIKKDFAWLRMIEAKNVRYLLFVAPGKKEYLINLDNLYDPCGLYVFDGKRPPQNVDMANVETGISYLLNEK